MDGTFTQARKPLSVFVFSLFVSLALVGCGAEGVRLSGENAIREPASDDFDAETETLDRSQSIGFYADGSILNAVALPAESFAHLKIFRLRDRGWGTRPLVEAITRAARAFRFKFPEGDRVSIGDMSSEDGGQLSRHSSHQNGLDADIAYLRADHVERNPDVWGNEGFGESFVKNGKVTKNFDQMRNWYFIKELVARGNVQRIFVDPAIKRLFCEKNGNIDRYASAAERTEILRRLRPYPNHADHLHMRVTCPKQYARCVPQDEVPAGSGCNSIDSLVFDEHEL